MRRTPYILILALISLLGSCSGEMPAQEQGSGEGRFHLSIITAAVSTEDITRATVFNFDTDTFKVTVTDAKGLELITKKENGQFTDADRTLPTANDYKMEVESCSETEAVAYNNAWGKERFYAQTTFDIATDQTTPLSLECTMANAGLTVIFDNSFVTKFPTHAVTTQDVRSLVFKSSDASSVAYYNTDQLAVVVTIRLTGSAGGWSDRIDMTRDVTLTKGKITRLRVRYDDGTNTDGEANVTFDTDTSTSETNDEVMVE